jgi:hypothetical protein
MLITRTNKQGIDKAIGKLQTWLHNHLTLTWELETDDPLYKCYPRIYRNLTDSGYIPETKLTDNASGYSEVLWDDKLKALSFFGASQQLDMDAQATQEVHIIFFVNLTSLKPGNERRDEEVRLDVFKTLEQHMYGFNLKRMITGARNVLKEYDGSRILDKDFQYKVDMHPYHCFRFDMELIYEPTQCY